MEEGRRTKGSQKVHRREPRGKSPFLPRLAIQGSSGPTSTLGSRTPKSLASVGAIAR